MRPLLQLALDRPALKHALPIVDSVGDAVDIIEAGTVLLAEEGMSAVRSISAISHGRPVLADMRIVRAGGALAALAFGAGADLVVAMSDAPVETLSAASQQANAFGGEIRLELADEWADEDTSIWRDLGIQHLILHLSVEADEAGREVALEDLRTIESLHQIGFNVTVTGGLNPSDVGRFSDVPVAGFVAGRAIADAPDPHAAASDFRKAIAAAFP